MLLDQIQELPELLDGERHRRPPIASSLSRHRAERTLDPVRERFGRAEQRELRPTR
jgi:hypothetical protein